MLYFLLHEIIPISEKQDQNIHSGYDDLRESNDGITSDNLQIGSNESRIYLEKK